MTDLSIACVLFDLDGTLVDSAPDLLVATNRLLLDFGRPLIKLECLRPVVSKGSRAMLAVAFPDLDAAARENLVPTFLDYYGTAISDQSRAFEGVEQLLGRIERARVRWGIVTNKPEGLARAVVAKLGWTQRCAVLVGGDSLPKKKPDPDQLLHACVQLGVEPGRCVYVGDDERDVQAARAAAMPSVVALWGYREAHDDPTRWGADRRIGFPLELCFGLVDGFGRDKY
ncbi:MAG: phosphoglycolate phosphatase [Proteobacteria bacterium]|nr:phosphoglycolate phosphatase [Pseudomonadota bacterium]MBS0463298.1 phosphoglycolate phosphatase [Pseudomonadota bacterium]MBS0463929.1 phosphoglycolate phosphatase [Pseudomonadota bacterium]